MRISEAAALSIVEQADYYLQASGHALAERWEEAVNRAVHSLLKLPERGAPCRFRAPALAGLRWIFVPGFPKHMIFYHFSPQDSFIRIVQVLHGARNLETVLDDDMQS
jgi:plasmid stabilization system protein ParE